MRDYQLDGHSPKCAMQVQQVAEALDVLRHAHACGEAVVPWGGGTHQDWGDRLTRYDVALDLTHLKGVLAYRPEELTLTAQVGVTLSEVNELVEKHGQCLPLDTEEPERATLGGAIATGAAGPWRMRYGTARDAILWCEVLSSDGRRI
jgi:glycolate oxidase FAD binding subunit